MGVKASVRTSFDFPVNVMIGTRVDRAQIYLQPEGHASTDTWSSVAVMSFADLYFRPSREIWVVCTPSWFVTQARLGVRSEWLQLDASLS